MALVSTRNPRNTRELWPRNCSRQPDRPGKIEPNMTRHVKCLLSRCELVVNIATHTEAKTLGQRSRDGATDPVYVYANDPILQAGVGSQLRAQPGGGRGRPGRARPGGRRDRRDRPGGRDRAADTARDPAGQRSAHRPDRGGAGRVDRHRRRRGRGFRAAPPRRGHRGAAPGGGREGRGRRGRRARRPAGPAARPGRQAAAAGALAARAAFFRAERAGDRGAAAAGRRPGHRRDRPSACPTASAPSRPSCTT